MGQGTLGVVGDGLWTIPGVWDGLGDPQKGP